MLKQAVAEAMAVVIAQPPLGGCVLKQDMHVWLKRPENPAAFRRLCVETI